MFRPSTRFPEAGAGATQPLPVVGGVFSPRWPHPTPATTGRRWSPGRTTAYGVLIRLATITATMLATAVTYSAAILIRGAGPDPADLQVAFSVGPVVVLLSIALGTALWRYQQTKVSHR